MPHGRERLFIPPPTSQGRSQDNWGLVADRIIESQSHSHQVEFVFNQTRSDYMPLNRAGASEQHHRHIDGSRAVYHILD